jgi:hypothetical protein
MADHLPHTDLSAGRPIVAGQPFEVRVPLVAGPHDAPATGYDGTEDVSGLATFGPGAEAAWALAVAWDDPFDADAPAIVISGEAEDTAEIGPGTYYALVTIDGVAGYLGTIPIVAGVDAGAVLSPTPLITVEEFRARVGGWAETLQTGTTGAGLRRTLSLATADLHDLIADRYSLRWHGTSLWATERAAFVTAMTTSGNLTTTNAMRDYVAARALLRLIEFQPGAKDANQSTERILARAEAMARMALSRISAVVTGYDYPIAFSTGQRRVERG